MSMPHDDDTYPIIPIKNNIIFPTISEYFLLNDKKSINSVEKANKNGARIVIVGQADISASQDSKVLERVYNVGTLCKINSIIRYSYTDYKVLVTGLSRFNINKTYKENSIFMVSGECFPELLQDQNKERITLEEIKRKANDTIDLLPNGNKSVKKRLNKIRHLNELIYLCSSFFEIDMEHRQTILEEPLVLKKTKILLEWIEKEKDFLIIKNNLKKGPLKTESISQVQLGKEISEEKNDLITKIYENNIPEPTRKLAIKEAKRIDHLNFSSSEYQNTYNYINTLCELPWGKSTKKVINIIESENILNEHHFDLEKIKKRILEHIAVRILNGNLKGSILCLVGPPGVGKTSLGKSIAEALGKKFIKISVGGISDEAEIRGHRRTYIGSMPGNIIQAIKRAGVNDPLILLDEIDKMNSTGNNGAISAMLEVLDPEQNKRFTDNYLNTAFNLSKVFFMSTANQIDNIPYALRDRMEVIELSSYTLNEKLNICKKHIIPKVLKENAINTESLIFNKDIIELLIVHYTREAGVRELKRVIESISRGIALEIVRGKSLLISINKKKVLELLGPYKYLSTQKLRKWSPGLVTGLAWTDLGGNIIYIESILIPGTGKFKITGQLGCVMKESAEIALSYITSLIYKFKLNIDIKDKDIHLHVPEGSIPKDGPSAGIAMLVAMMSLLTEKSIPQDIAMTGEITLSGSILQVGGIKEKILAAYRNDIKNIIIPKSNVKDLYDVPNEIKNKIHFQLVESVDDVFHRFFEMKIYQKQKNKNEFHQFSNLS